MKVNIICVCVVLSRYPSSMKPTPRRIRVQLQNTKHDMNISNLVRKRMTDYNQKKNRQHDS